MGAYENYTGPIYNPAGEQALGQAASNIGQMMGSAIEKRAALERAEKERRRKEAELKAKENKAINQRIQAEAFSQTARANETLSKDIDEAGLDKKVFTGAVKPLMDELGTLGAQLKYDTRLTGVELQEKRNRYSELYQQLNTGIPETMSLLSEYAEGIKNAAEVPIGEEGGFDEEDNPQAYYAKMVMNGSIQGKFHLNPGERGAMDVVFSGIEGMDDFTISADSLTRPNYNIVPKGSDITDTKLDDAHANQLIKGYTSKEGAMTIINDAKSQGLSLADAGYSSFIGVDGAKYARLNKEVIKSKLGGTIRQAAIEISSDPLQAKSYYNNVLSSGEGDRIELINGQLSDEDKQMFEEKFVDKQAQRVYETSGAGIAIQIESAASRRAKQASTNEKDLQANAINNVSSQMQNFANIFMPSISTGEAAGEGSIAQLDESSMQDYLIGRQLDGNMIQDVEYNSNTNELVISTVDTDVDIKTLKTDVEGLTDSKAKELTGKDKKTKTTSTKVKPYTFKLTKEGGGVHKLGNMLFLTTASSRQKLGGAFEEFVNKGYKQAQESFIDKAGSVDLMRSSFGLDPISPNVVKISDPNLQL